MKILGGDLVSSPGSVSVETNKRVGKLRQDPFAFEGSTVLENDPVTLISVIHDRELFSSLAIRIIDVSYLGVVNFGGHYQDCLKGEDVAA